MAEPVKACPFNGANSDIYSRQDFEAIAQIVFDETGILLSDGKAMLPYSRLAKRLRANNIPHFSDYIRRLNKDSDERRLAINLLTTNHTYFFREPHHFEHFEGVVRPALLEKALGRKSVRMWSAGCSSGEEVYSLVISYLGTDQMQGSAIARSDSLFLATDIADHAIEAAREAVYPLDAVKPVPEALKHNWMSLTDDSAKLVPIARDLVRFRRLNLMRGWPLKNLFDVIFCRNVMIYFDGPTKERLLQRFAAQLAIGGYLYIGHSERLTGPASACFEAAGKTIYRKVR